MVNLASTRIHHIRRKLLAVGAVIVFTTLLPLNANSQTPVTAPFDPRPIPRGVLGGVPMTAADSMVQTIVARLDLDSFKSIIRSLTEFGDREQGTERNAQAVDWIEAQLRSWGYQTERIRYEYPATPDTSAAARARPPVDRTRQEVYATKVGATVPQEMYILSAHMDGRGGGQGANDNASGTALVMEIARVLAAPDIQTTRSVRFALWNNEETGLDGAEAYVAQRAALQGQENPPGSGRYPEPRWLGNIQHDKVLFDHGNPVQYAQVLDADVDVEFQLVSEKWQESAQLAIQLINANRMFATDFPAAMSNSMSNTDSTPFMDLIPAVSVRENRRLFEIGRGSDPHWHQRTDLYTTFSDSDFRLGYNAMQMTLGATGRLVEARIVAPR